MDRLIDIMLQQVEQEALEKAGQNGDETRKWDTVEIAKKVSHVSHCENYDRDPQT
jgi:hypothetical protein